MAKLTLQDVLSQADPHNLLKAHNSGSRPSDDALDAAAIAAERAAFIAREGRAPSLKSDHPDELRLAVLELRRAFEAGELRPRPDWRRAADPADVPVRIEAVFSDLLLLEDDDLFDLLYSRPAHERALPLRRASVTLCQDFQVFALRFERIQAEIDQGLRRVVEVTSWSQANPAEGDIFLRAGLYALIVEKSEPIRRGSGRDYRLRVVFSDGTESDPMLSAFRKWLKAEGGAVQIANTGLGPLDPGWSEDLLGNSGRIYVCRSLSTVPAIRRTAGAAFKIGVTSQDVTRHIADAAHDPSFLLAPVELVASHEIPDLPRWLVAEQLHGFLEPARLRNLFIRDRNGEVIYPREWFRLDAGLVAEIAHLIRARRLERYRYDPESGQILRR